MTATAVNVIDGTPFVITIDDANVIRGEGEPLNTLGTDGQIYIDTLIGAGLPNTYPPKGSVTPGEWAPAATTDSRLGTLTDLQAQDITSNVFGGTSGKQLHDRAQVVGGVVSDASDPVQKLVKKPQSFTELDKWIGIRGRDRYLPVDTSQDIDALGLVEDHTYVFHCTLIGSAGIALNYTSRTLVRHVAGINNAQVSVSTGFQLGAGQLAILKMNATTVEVSVMDPPSIIWQTSQSTTQLAEPRDKWVIADGHTIELTALQDGEEYRFGPATDWANVGGVVPSATFSAGWTIDSLPTGGPEEIVITKRFGQNHFRVFRVADVTPTANDWQALTPYAAGNEVAAPEPDAGDPDVGRFFRWRTLVPRPDTVAAFDVAEKSNWQRMALEADPDNWTVQDGDVGTLWLATYGSPVRLIGASQSLLLPTPGGQNVGREARIWNDSSNVWTVNAGSANTRKIGNAANDPSTNISLQPGEILNLVSTGNFDTVYSIAGETTSLAKNMADFTAGDLTLQYFQDDVTGADGAYHPDLTPTANFTFPALENGRRILLGTDWAARQAAAGPPTWTTQGVDTLNLPSSGWPAEGNELVWAIAKAATNEWLIRTSGDITLNYVVPTYDNDAEALSGVGSNVGSLFQGSGSGDLTDALYRVKADTSRVVV